MYVCMYVVVCLVGQYILQGLKIFLHLIAIRMYVRIQSIYFSECIAKLIIQQLPISYVCTKLSLPPLLYNVTLSEWINTYMYVYVCTCMHGN